MRPEKIYNILRNALIVNYLDRSNPTTFFSKKTHRALIRAVENAKQKHSAESKDWYFRKNIGKLKEYELESYPTEYHKEEFSKDEDSNFDTFNYYSDRFNAPHRLNFYLWFIETYTLSDFKEMIRLDKLKVNLLRWERLIERLTKLNYKIDTSYTFNRNECSFFLEGFEGKFYCHVSECNYNRIKLEYHSEEKIATYHTASVSTDGSVSYCKHQTDTPEISVGLLHQFQQPTLHSVPDYEIENLMHGLFMRIEDETNKK
jgi:hypothetical protein